MSVKGRNARRSVRRGITGTVCSTARTSARDFSCLWNPRPPSAVRFHGAQSCTGTTDVESEEMPEQMEQIVDSAQSSRSQEVGDEPRSVQERSERAMSRHRARRVSVETEFPELAELVSLFFDGYEDAIGPVEVVVGHYSKNPRNAPRVRQELSELLGQPDVGIERTLAELNNRYDFDAAGLTARQWVEQMLAQVEREKPVPNPRYARLVGQVVRDVLSGDNDLTIVLDSDKVRVQRPVLKRSGSMIDEPVLLVTDFQDMFTIATRRGRIRTEGPKFEVTENV